MLWRWETGNMVPQYGPETGAGLGASVPVLGPFMFAPRHVAEIVQHRNMRGGGDVGQGKVIPRQPVPLVGEIGDIVEMGMDVRSSARIAWELGSLIPKNRFTTFS